MYVLYFLPLHAIAMEQYCYRMASVCPSVCDVEWFLITYVGLRGILLHG